MFDLTLHSEASEMILHNILWLVMQNDSTLLQQPPIPRDSRIALNIAGGEVRAFTELPLMARYATIAWGGVK